MSLDKAGQLGDFDTITREQYRRINGAAPAVPAGCCLECGEALTPVQIKRGGKFCSSRCGGTYNARVPAKPKEETPVAIVHDLPTPPAAAAPQLIVELLAQLAGTAILHADRWDFDAAIGDVHLTLHKEPAS